MLGAILDGLAAGSGVLAGGGTTATGGTAGVTQFGISLGAAIYYMIIEGELRGAVDQLQDKLNDKDFKELWYLIDQQHRGESQGVIDIPGKGDRSYFFVRQGNRVIVFRVTRSRGLELLGQG